MKKILVPCLLFIIAWCGRSELITDIVPPILDGGEGGIHIECRGDEDCDDGNLCNGRERCVEGVCVSGEPVICDDGIDCTVDSCNERTGTCVFIPDHDRCGYNEICDPQLGCISRRCTTDEDCDDGLFCNGREFCEDGTCRSSPAPVCDDGIDCTLDRCDEDLDRCVNEPQDSLCDDGLYCNGREYCDPNLGCLHGEPVDCDDGDPCTVDSCDEVNDRCVYEIRDQDRDHHGDEACGGDDCDDSDPTVHPGAQEQCHDLKDNDCNGRVDCDDPACYSDPRCNPVECETDQDCDDGNPCNGQERCVDGFCQSGIPIICDDGIDCTIDECDPITGECVFIPDDDLCPVGYHCNPERGCVPSGCITDQDCDDGIDCTIDRCDLSSGIGICINEPDDSLCDEGERCVVGVGCVPIVECETDQDCDDGIYCNGEERCVGGVCVTFPIVCPDDGIACTIEYCDRNLDRCVSEPDDSLCDDGLICNGEERCDPSIGCVNGEPLDCDDGDPCTEDQCVEGIGCVWSIIDRDNDGYGDMRCGGADCDDTDPNINPGVRENCTDNIDNNCNLLIDCDDPDCISDPVCCVPEPEICSDNVDNDCDGLTDCSDPDCFNDPVCEGCRPEVCWDGVDNDCDNLIDCEDPDCFNDPACQICEPEICNDTIDNDCDNLIDCADPDCFGSIECQDRNDTCAQAIEIGPGTYRGTTIGYVDDYHPIHGGECWGGFGPDAVYTFVITQPSHVIADTFGSDFDTVLYIRAIRCPNGRQVACDDDYNSLQSRVEITNLPPGRYFLFVDGYDRRSYGNYVLHLEIGPAVHQEICDNGIDDDNDGLVDCDDPDCSTDPVCVCVPTGPEDTLWNCIDWEDNDCDGRVDCDDPDCHSPVPFFSQECCNGEDDNNNMLIDEFACACFEDEDCDGSYVCHSETVGRCGPRCDIFAIDWCQWIYPGSVCDRDTGHCVLP